MRKYAYIIFIIAILLSVILYISLHLQKHLQKPVLVDFKYVGTFNRRNTSFYDYWTIVNDEKKTDVDSSILKELCDIDGLNMDFENFSYIVTDGYVLLDLYYIPLDYRNLLSFSPDYYGYVTLRKVDEDIHIYCIPRDIPIIKDLHAHFDDDFRTTILH